MVLFLPHEAASVPVTRQVLDGCLQTLGVTPDTRADIALALTEACANVIQHARSDDQYEVQVRARDGRCAIEVVNAGSGNGEPAPYRGEDDEGWAGAMALSSDPVPGTAEHGRGLKIINAVVDNLQLTGNEREGRTVHFEKTLDWLPGGQGIWLAVGLVGTATIALKAAGPVLNLLGNFPTSLDPDEGGGSSSSLFLDNLFSGLVRYDAGGDWVPDLASGWTVSSDRATYTFNLRRAATFRNGDPVTASDFRYSITRSLIPALKSPSAPTYLQDILGASAVLSGKAKSVSGLRVVDSKTLQLTTLCPAPYFRL